ncbi:MAG: nucleotidyltransferase domain-containing protein [Nanoarchaeota archaeon]
MQSKHLKQELLQLDAGKRIQFIVVFGSVAAGRANALSDVDVAVYYQGTPEERFQFRKKMLGTLPEKVDVQIFQDLPVAVQKEVLSGKVLYYQDFQFMFDEYLKVIQEYDFFEKHQREYFAVLEANNGT